MEKVSWIDRKTNEEVLKMIDEKREVLARHKTQYNILLD